MSATEPSSPVQPVGLEALPQFELAYLFDQQDEPTEVTVFPASDEFDISTNWISAEIAATVPLEKVR